MSLADSRAPSTPCSTTPAPLLALSSSALLAAQHTPQPPARSPLPADAPSSSLPTAQQPQRPSHHVCGECLAAGARIELGDELGVEAAVAELKADVGAHAGLAVPEARTAVSAVHMIPRHCRSCVLFSSSESILAGVPGSDETFTCKILHLIPAKRRGWQS